jgi:hypothetical protein
MFISPEIPDAPSLVTLRPQFPLKPRSSLQSLLRVLVHYFRARHLLVEEEHAHLSVVVSKKSVSPAWLAYVFSKCPLTSCQITTRRWESCFFFLRFQLHLQQRLGMGGVVTMAV